MQKEQLWLPENWKGDSQTRSNTGENTIQII